MIITLDTPAGPLRGRSDGDVAAFLGIPYAEPPVDGLRFAPPVRRAPFAQPFDALAYGPTPQRVPLFEVTTIPEPSIPGADILNLNVFAPAGGVGCPVLFWIHGGGYVAGSAASPWYDGAAFARDGVVVVSAAYRLGVDGFGAPGDAPANLGLRDLIAALEWVRDSIASFGGDPSRITIAGQSAGGGAVLALLASPRAEGLFSAAIAVSGVDVALAPEAARAATARVAAALGVPATRAGLGSLPDELLQRTLSAARDGDAPLAFAPTAGDDVLPLDIVTGVSRHSTTVPLLIGATADEFDGGPTVEWPDKPDLTPAERTAARAAGERLTDTLFRAACMRIARARAQAASTWLYSFDWVSPATRGATHCIDIPFFFGNLDRPGVPEALGPRPPVSLEAAMHRDFVAFVRTHELPWAPAAGNPGDVARRYGLDDSAEVADVAGEYDPVLRRVDG